MKFVTDGRSDIEMDDEEKVEIERLMKILQEMKEKGHTHINFLCHDSDPYRDYDNGSVTMEFGSMKEKKKYRVFDGGMFQRSAIVEAYSEEEVHEMVREPGFKYDSENYDSAAIEVQEVK